MEYHSPHTGAARYSTSRCTWFLAISLALITFLLFFVVGSQHPATRPHLESVTPSWLRFDDVDEAPPRCPLDATYRDRLERSERTFQAKRRVIDDFVRAQGGIDAFHMWPFVPEHIGPEGLDGTGTRMGVSEALDASAYDLTPPAFGCPLDMERVGNWADGGKGRPNIGRLRRSETAQIVCGMSTLEAHDSPVVYSFGVNILSDFEAEVLNRTKAHIWGFDFSVAHWGPEVEDVPEYKARSTFRPWMITDHFKPDAQPPQYSLSDLMRTFNHTYIDLLKFDIESAEYQLIPLIVERFTKKGLPMPFGQLQIEVHACDPAWCPDEASRLPFATWYNLHKMLLDAGLRPFDVTWNPWPIMWAPNRPYASEYSFVNVVHPQSPFYIESVARQLRRPHLPFDGRARRHLRPRADRH